VSYVLFVLVGLYDLGKDDDKEDEVAK